MGDNQKKDNKQEQESTSQNQEFKSDNVVVALERLPGCKVKLNITVTPQGSNAAYKKAIKSVNKEVSLPGFRKGKAPEALVLEHYEKYVDQEWREILINTAFQEALTITGIYPLNKETIRKPQVNNVSKENGAEITIEFESAPEIPTIDPSQIKLQKVEKVEVTPEQEKETLENIQHHHANWEKMEGRPVKQGDYIEIDIENLDEPGHFLCKDSRFEVAPGKMGKWMIDLVVGKNLNDVVEGTSERSKDLPEDIEFKPTRCKITIKGILEAKLPDVDDELAKKLGASDVEDLKKKVRESLESQAEQEVRHQLREQLETFISAHYPFDIPESLLLQEKKSRLEGARHDLTKSGLSKEKVAERISQMQETIDENILRAFRLFFISRRIAEENDITVSQEEMIRELMEQMYSQGTPMNASGDIEEAKSRVYISLLSQKVKDFLIDKASVE